LKYSTWSFAAAGWRRGGGKEEGRRWRKGKRERKGRMSRVRKGRR